MIIFDTTLQLEAKNDNDCLESLPKRLQKKTMKATIKKMMKYGDVSHKVAQNEYQRMCKTFEITNGKQVLALELYTDPDTGRLQIATYV